MEKLYKYCVYDLVIESEIEIPKLDKLLLENQPTDIKIEIGKLPEISEKVIIENSYSKVAKHEYLCEVKDVASFYVGYGSRIVIQICEDADMEVVYLFLLGHVLGVLLGQRELVAIHSSSVVINGNAVLICGFSGAGKSTTSAILTERGYKLLADDISVIKVGEQDQKVRTYRGFPEQKLCPDVVKRLKINTKGMKHITYQKEKYHAINLERFAYKPTLVKGIFEIRKSKENHLKVIEVLGRNKLASIVNNIFLRKIKYFAGGTNQYMNDLIRIAQEVPYFIIERPEEGFSGDEIADYIVDFASTN